MNINETEMKDIIYNITEEVENELIEKYSKEPWFHSITILEGGYDYFIQLRVLKYSPILKDFSVNGIPVKIKVVHPAILL